MRIKKFFIILSCILCFMLAISSVSAFDVDNETSTESTSDDSLMSTDVGGGNFANLRDAMYLSNNITLTGDIVKDSGENELKISKSQIVINGNGHTISANNNGRIFTILPSCSLSLINVKLINGNLPETLQNDFDGGAILNMGTLTVQNCEFTNNYARDGGAIAADRSAKTTLTGTNTFSKNRAWGDGGAIANQFGSTLTISGKNTFDSNSANFDGSAAIQIDEGKGGAIMNAFAAIDDPSEKAKLSIEGTTIFNNNIAKADGGAIFNHQAFANVTGSNTFTNNKAVFSEGKGGAINNENATFYLSGDNTFQSNSAYRGGAIDNSLFLSTFTINGKNRFINNKGSMGGAISNQQARAFYLYGENIFESNSANFATGPKIGGAIYSFQATFNLDGSNIFSKNTAQGSGGAFYSANNNLYIKGTNSFNSNSAPLGGALLLIDSSLVELSGENVFSSNTATSSGGAIRANNVQNLVFMDHNYLSNNRADHSGGAIYVLNSGLNIHGTLFESNSAIYGGAIFLEKSSLYANYNIFKNNHADKTGADIECYSSSISNLNYNYWNSQNKVAQSNINNYAVSNINTWVKIDLTIPSQIKESEEVEVVRFKSNSNTDLAGEMPIYGVSVSPNFNPSTTIITHNIGKSTYTGSPGQVTVNAASSNFAASKVVNVVEKRLNTFLSGTNIVLNTPDQSAKYEVILTDSDGRKLSGKSITITVDSKKYTQTTDNNGKASLTVSGLTNGYHEVVSSYAGETKYYASTTTNGIICLFNNETSTQLTGKDIEMYFKDGSRYEVTLKDKNGNLLTSKDVKFYINGALYTRTTDNNGKASIAINLIAGDHDITAIYPGDSSNEFAFVENTISIKSTISGNDIVKYFKNGTQYYAKFMDSKGNPLKNTDITYNINGVMYTRKTDDNGFARMNINLAPGTYIITATHPNNGEMHSNQITVKSIFKGNDLTKYYRNDSQYTIKVLGQTGEPIGAGVDITFNINGVFYTRTTNASGIAKMNINLNPGTYIITAEYNGLMYSNTIKVLPILSAKDITMKYKDGTKFEVKLVDGQGKAFPNKNVTFNVNGVFYNRTTDSEGYARLAINLMAGQYIITSMYNAAAISNRITITN